MYNIIKINIVWFMRQFNLPCLICSSSYRIARSSYAILTRKKQIFYYMYGWITPALIVGLTATVEYFPGLSEYLIKPEFSNNCWFKKGKLKSYVSTAYFLSFKRYLMIGN